MCIVEQKTYYEADGSPRLFESIRRCENAVGSGTCLNVNHTFARIVETKPESSSRTGTSSRVESSSRADVVVTDNRGHTRVYRDLSRRSSQKNKSGRSKREEDRNPRDRRREAPSPISGPRRPSPIARNPTPNSAPPRMSSFPPSLPPESTGRVAEDGTAIYDYPTSNVPRTPIIERRPTTPGGRKVSFMSPENEPTDRPRRPSLAVNTGGRRSVNNSPTRASPGLSQIPKIRHSRKDSARDLPRRDSSREDNEYPARESARDEARRQAAARRRQEDLQAAEDRELDREAERHRSRLADAFRPARTSLDSERSSWSRHTSPPRQSRMVEEQQPRYASASPMPSRSSLRRPSYGRPTLHQDPTIASQRPSDAFLERGREVIEERRRSRLGAEEQRTTLDDRDRRYEPVFEDFVERTSERGYYVSEGPARLARRRKDKDRDERKKEFWS